MDYCTVTTQFVANTKARASEVNTNFSDITSAISGGKDLACGGLVTGMALTSGAFTITDTDGYCFVGVTATTAKTVTLPTLADNFGRIITVKKLDTGSGVLTISGEGAENIDGYNYRKMPTYGDFITVQGGTNEWHIIHMKVAPTKKVLSTNRTIGATTGSTEVNSADRHTIYGPGLYRVTASYPFYATHLTNTAATFYFELQNTTGAIAGSRKQYSAQKYYTTSSHYSGLHAECMLSVTGADDTIRIHAWKNDNARITGAMNYSNNAGIIITQLVG